MALFKIEKGVSGNLAKNRPNTIEGYCYVTTDDGKMYIDIKTGGQANNPEYRMVLNAGHADTTTLADKAITADKLTTARKITLSGDVSGETLFDGSQDITINSILANTGVTKGFYGLSADAEGTNGTEITIPYLNIDSDGRILNAYNKKYKAINTDTLVKQNVTTKNLNYPLLLAKNGLTATTNGGEAYFDSGVTLNPSTNTIAANISGNAATADLATELKTARTIFGQSFNGSANVAGQPLVYGTYTSTASHRFNLSGIQIRENELVGSTQSDIGYAPSIGFHWSERIAATMLFHNDGNFYLRKQDGTSRASLDANLIGNASTATTAASCSGNAKTATTAASCSGNAATATTAAKLGRGGDTAYPMTFNWSGQDGQPSWLWGGSDGTNMYVYNPSNFSVNYANSCGTSSNSNWLNTNSTLQYGASGLNYFNISGTAGSAANANQTPTADWYHIIRMNHANANGYYIDIASCFHSNDMYMKRVASGTSYGWKHIWVQGNSVTGAVWNDYAECRESDCKEFGYVLMEVGDDSLTKTTERLSHFAGVSSDTWGFSQGETDKAKTPIAVAGRVLVYPYQDKNNYKPGDCVCAAPGGTVDIMTREEVINWPDRIVGTVSCVPDYEEWGGGEGADRPPIKVNNRIWIKVK